MITFNVTFERYLPHADDEDICDADERGFELEGASLRDAIACIGGTCDEANEWPVRAPRWLTNNHYNEGTREEIEQGIREARSLHIPETVTAASRRRIARLLGVRVS